MDEENDSADRIGNFIRSNFLFLALLSGGVIFLSIGFIQMFGAKSAEIKFEKAQEIETAPEIAEIKVDVDGAVQKPGLYTLKGDARVQDALVAAGGLRGDADRRAINLAAKVADGQKLYIPAVGEEVPLNLVSASSEVLGSGSSLISLNSATESELDTLPGIGPVTVRKIIDGRPYTSIDELLSRKVVGQATFEKISGLISL